MASIESQGAVVYWSTSTAFSTAQSVGQVMSFSGPGPSAASIDVTHLGSTAKEKLQGLMDSGQISIDMIYDPANAGQTALRTDLAARTKRNVGIKFTDTSSSVVHGDAYCISFGPISAAVDDALKVSATFEITGALTWTTN